MRAALYHRVSTVDQDATAARDELHAVAMRLGASVVLDVEETGSGAGNDRPGLLEVMSAARRGRVDVVIVWKLDRWGRSALDVLANLRELEAAGVRFYCAGQGLDIRPGGDAMSRLMLQMLAAIAEFERELIKDRTRLGMQRARARGARLGRPPAELEQDLVRRAHELAARGTAVRAIARELAVSARLARRALATPAPPPAPPITCPECGRRNYHLRACSLGGGPKRGSRNGARAPSTTGA